MPSFVKRIEGTNENNETQNNKEEKNPQQVSNSNKEELEVNENKEQDE